VAKKKKRARRKEPIPYPLLAPTEDEVPDWDVFHNWQAARYCRRDNLRRALRNKFLALPPICPEWDPPIPLPLILRTTETRPRTNIKAIKVPEDMDFSKYRLSAER
jgi:hypothetical protein